MNKTKRIRAGTVKWLGLCVLLLVALCSCVTLSGGPLTGRAVDAGTGRPLTNAVAYGIWDGLLTSITRTDGNCIWAESAQLDAQGKFRLPAWIRFDPRKAPFTSDIQQSIFVYAPGYALTTLSAGDFPEVKMKRFVGTVDERFHELKVSPCVPTGSRHRLAVVYRMMADEMDHAAVTIMQHQQADSLRSLARAARTDPSKPTTRDDFGSVVNISIDDQYPE